jgi:DNA-binding NarL/FixJ family response regulator
MKDLNGLFAAKKITSSFPGAEIIILTGFNSATYRHEAKKAGASAYLLKKDLYELKNFTTRNF